MNLYNTASRSLEQFNVDQSKQVKLYTCGLTVYSPPHIGNWVGYVYWDVLVRLLMYKNIPVIRTQNYTDVGHLVSDDDSGEDKMQKGAMREGSTAWDIAEKYIAIADFEAFELLKFIKPNYLVRATDMIPQQIEFAQQLDAKGYLYKINGDGMYFDTSKLSDYGKLAKIDIAGLEGGKRVSIKGKRSITDFAVWKFSPNDQKRDMEWKSPWGTGFPGWHLECSVIARETLGDQIDIHTGGIDHIPVHHTNEIAQTEAVTGLEFSNFWLHNNHLKVDGSKMAKSLGNIYTLSDVIERGFTVEAFKLFVMSKHYRSEGNFTWEQMEVAQQRLDSFERLSDLRFQTVERSSWLDDNLIEKLILQHIENDLNTVLALNAISGFITKAETELIAQQDVANFNNLLAAIDSLLGLSLLERHDITEEQKLLLRQRELARENHDWQSSDAIRATLEQQSIGVRDTPSGSIWYRLRPKKEDHQATL